METKIKNTLFRFVAFRKPEQIDNDKKINLFVHHPNQQQSALYATTEAEFNTKLTAFETGQHVKSKTDLKAINEPLYNLAFWVLQNRESVTTSSFQAKIDELSPTTLDIEPSTVNEILVWDNFIYQIATHKDDVAREAAMTLLYGNYLLKQQTLQNALVANTTTNSFVGTVTPAPPNPNAITTKQFRRILQARIVRPEFLAFPPTAVATTPTNSDPQPLSLQTQQQFRTALNRLTSKTTVANLEKLKNELASVAKKYNKLEAQNVKAYDMQYQSDYNDYLATINSISASSLTGGEGSSSDGSGSITTPPPPYNYTPLVQLDATRLESQLTPESLELYNEIASEDLDNFADLEELINQKIHTESSSLFSNRQFTSSINVIGNIPIPTQPTNPIYDYNYKVQAVKLYGGNRYSFNLVIKVPNNLIQVDSINYKVSVNNVIKGISTEAVFTNDSSIVSGILFEDIGVLFALSTSQVLLEADIIFDNGSKYKLSQIVTLKSEASGVLEDVTKPGSTNQQPGTTTGTNTGTTTTSGGTTSSSSIPEMPSYKKYGVTRLGIADYRKVEQSICCYVPGEVSHIENVMASEYKERATKRLRRSENTVTTESSTETENLTDSTSTERNEMHQEIAKMQQQSMDISAGVSASYSGFGATISANASFALHNSKEQSNNMARTEARELTERASEKVVSKKREERISKIIDEFTDENKHGYDNRTNKEHVSGVYRWIDKVYKNEIYNYGKRLMYEFMIPEPAKFHLLSNDVIVLNEPYDFVKKDDITDSSKITRTNYLAIAEKNNAQVDVWADEYIYLSKYYLKDIESGKAIKHQTGEITFPIPANYQVDSISGYFKTKSGNDGAASNSNVQPFANKFGFIYIGGVRVPFAANNLDSKEEMQFNIPKTSFGDKVITDELNLSMTTWDVGSYNLNIVIKCKMTEKATKELQVETYDTLIKDYNDKMAIYQEKLAELRGKKVNPLFYRQIENTVLRKNCISYLLGYDNVGKSFQLGTSMPTHKISDSAIGETSTLSSYSSKVKFMEQAFEWEIMSYVFYPFYWAYKDSWIKLYGQETDDVLFTNFLQSGMARVVLTVRPGFEDAVNWFLETGQVWNGLSSPPVIGDDLYLSIVDELQEPEYTVEGSWETRVPSTLTVIQDSGVGLHAEGLPCACKQETKEEFTGNGNTLSSGTQQSEGVGSWTVNPDDENQTPPIYVPPTTESKS